MPVYSTYIRWVSERMERQYSTGSVALKTIIIPINITMERRLRKCGPDTRTAAQAQLYRVFGAFKPTFSSWAWYYGYSRSIYPKAHTISAQSLLVRTGHVAPVWRLTQTQWSSQNAVTRFLLIFATSLGAAAIQILNPESQLASWLTYFTPRHSL